MFKIVQKRRVYDILILKNTKTHEYVSIIPEFGANINEIVLRADKLYHILDGYKTRNEFVENKGFKNSKLIPYPNRIKQGKYKFNNKLYELPINHPPHAIHGLIYNKAFKAMKFSINKKFCQVILRYDYDNECNGYPFKMQIYVQYTLNSKGFTAHTIIRNTDTKKIPIGDGWHPYFKLNNKIDNLYIHIPSTKKILTDKTLIPTGKISKYSNKLQKIGTQEFDDGFIINNSKTELYNPKNSLSIIITTKNYPYLQIYTPKHRKSIAIEPMTCMTDAFNNKKGLKILYPNREFKGSYSVYLKKNL